MRKMTKLPIVAAALCLCALLAACGSGGNLVVIDRPSQVSTTPSPGETTETAVVTPTPTPAPTTETLTPTVVTPTPTTTPVEPTTTPVEPTPTVVTPTQTVTPGPHEHIYGAWQTTAEPTCTLPGAQVHTCTICGESVAEVIPALGHDYVDIAPAAPTCTEKGSTGGVRCARCGEIITPPNEIPATGHTIVGKSDLAPTCTQDGSTGGTYCAVCGVIVEQPTVVKATGHTLVYEDKRLPTATKTGHTAGAVCAVCKEVFEQVETLPAKGTDWMLEDGAFKILLIGNSFSQDTANFRFENEGNMLLSILKAMLGGDVKIVIGVCQSGSKTMAWHATQAQSGRYLYSFHIISSDDPVWRSGREGDSSSQFALEYTNWDVVSLQPYHYEAVDGMDVEGEFASEIDERFYPMSVSIPYMLDHVQRYAPQADVYCIMPWNSTVDSVLNVGITKYEKSAAYFPQTLTYAGSESGKVFENIVPTALSVQNARSTYFGLFKYHTEDASKTQVFSYDSQFGLLRDGLHLSYNVGRYIASLTYAETVVPKEIRAKDYVLPSIRITESLGKLPDAYTELAQRCVAAALDSWSKGSLAVTKFTGDTVDPAVNAAAVLASVKLSVGLCKTEDALIKALSEAVLAVLPKDCVLESITLVDPFSSIGKKDFRVECVIRFGYTTQTVGAVGVME